MRPLLAHSTDVTYSPFPLAELMELGFALGVSDLKYVTTATQRADQVFFHACLNGIQTYVKIAESDELRRSEAIAAKANWLTGQLEQPFLQQAMFVDVMLKELKQQVAAFCGALHEAERGRAWNTAVFDAEHPDAGSLPRWQCKAIESYRQIRQRIQSGEYVPEDGIDAALRLSVYWSERNLEYKFYRDIARRLVEGELHRSLPVSELLTMHPAAERQVTIFFGGMGSGKSHFTDHYLEELSEEDRFDRVFHNADFLKLALYLRAIDDGVLTTDIPNDGIAVQVASSNAGYEGSRKRWYLGDRFNMAPDVLVNSTVLGAFEVRDGLNHHGQVTGHHLFIVPEEAVAEAAKRAETLGRAPAKGDIEWSAKAAAESLLLVTREGFLGENLTVHLYSRHAGESAVHYGTIDAANAVLHIEDHAMWETMCQVVYPELPAKDAADRFRAQFTEAGFSLGPVAAINLAF